jgi:hypothetical protein
MPDKVSVAVILATLVYIAILIVYMTSSKEKADND